MIYKFFGYELEVAIELFCLKFRNLLDLYMHPHPLSSIRNPSSLVLVSSKKEVVSKDGKAIYIPPFDALRAKMREVLVELSLMVPEVPVFTENIANFSYYY